MTLLTGLNDPIQDLKQVKKSKILGAGKLKSEKQWKQEIIQKRKENEREEKENAE